MNTVIKNVSASLLAAGIAVSAGAAPLAVRQQAMQRISEAGAMPRLNMQTSAGLPEEAESARRYNFAVKPDDSLYRVASPVEERRQKALKSATAAFRALDDNIDVRGQMTYHDAWDDSNFLKFQGFYSLPHSSEDTFYLRGLTSNGMNWGGYYDPENEIYYGIASDLSLSDGGGTYCYSLAYDTQTWQRIIGKSLPDFRMAAFSVARDPLTDIPYGYFINDYGNGMIWAEADYQNATRTKLADVEYTERMILMASDDAGEFYGINIKGELCKIDKTDGSHTVIAPTTLPILYRAGAVINNRNHTMLATTFHLDYGAGGIFDTSGSSGLWEINLETGETTRIAQFTGNVQVMNLYIDRTIQEKAPDAPGLTVSAPEGSMTATWEITIPETLYDGTPVQGNLDWRVLVEGRQIAQGSNMAGEKVSGQIELTKVGDTTFSAYCLNADGESATTNVTVFVGNGVPNAPKNVVLAHEDGKLTLSWDAVTTSSDGGYVSADDMRYIIRSLDGEEWTGVEGTSWDVPGFTEPVIRTVYQYSVTAVFDGRLSPETVGNFIALGAYNTPYDQVLSGLAFNEAVTKLGYSQINGDYTPENNDNNVWAFGTSGASFKIQYARTTQADDYMVLPAVYLEEGKVYEFNTSAYTQSSSTASGHQRLSVCVGPEATAESLSQTTIVEEMDVRAAKATPVIMRGTFKAPSTGSYYFAVRCTTPRTSGQPYTLGSNTVYITETHLTEGLSENSPALVENVVIERDADGAHKAKITATAPTKNIMGEDLSGNVTIEVYRDGTKVTSRSVKPGAAMSAYTDNVPAMGTYEYSVVAVQNGASGPALKQSVFIGPYAPKAPENVQMLEAYQPGYVMVMWNAVTEDINKNPLKATNVSYMVYKLGRDEYNQQVFIPMLDEPTKNCNAVFMANDNPDRQGLYEYYVKAWNCGEVEGTYARTPYLAIGNAYKLPVRYSNLSDLNSFVAGTGSILGGAGFSTVGDGDGIASQDLDDCFFASVSDALDKSCYLFTGKIDLADCERPELSFYTYRFDPEDRNSIQTHVLVDGEWVTITPTPDFGYARHADMEPGQWTKVRYDLSQYKGKFVQLRFTAYHSTHLNTLLDNIRVQEVADKDLAAVSIEAPATVKANTHFDITVKVTSFGWQTAKDFTVDLFRDGELMSTQTIPSLDYEETVTVMFDNVMTLFDENGTESSFSAAVNYDGDKEPANNATAEISVIREISAMPVVDDLDAQLTDRGTRLTWTPYQLEATGEGAFTEDFENAEAWGTVVDGWTMVDEDLQPIIRRLSSKVTLPYGSMTKLPWFVFEDTDWLETEPAALAHSGHKYLGASSSDNYDDDESYYPTIKDWAISPALNGQAQTITFWAKSLSGNNRMQVWYATEVTGDIKKFTQIKTFGNSVGNQTITKDWTEYSFEVPEGALCFALRSYSECKSMLMVDDVTYIPDYTYGKPVLVGYDIYRDGKKINTEPVVGNEYLDEDMPAGSHTYHVVGVFTDGPSELSNDAQVYLSGVGIVAAATAATVTADGHDIVVSNAGDATVAVATVDGKLLYRGNGDTRLTVAPAIYLVTVANTTTKLIVR